MLTPADLKDICAYVRHGQQDTLHSNDGRGYKRSSFIKKKIEILKFKKNIHSLYEVKYNSLHNYE